MEQAASLAHGDAIEATDVVLEGRGNPGAGSARTLAQEVDEAERRAIDAALARHDSNLERVARELDVSPTTLWRKMKRLGMRRD
jgi:two-component system response regulator HydG